MTPEMYSFLKPVERTEKGRREEARGSERWKERVGIEEKREGQIVLEREKRNSKAERALQPRLNLSFCFQL